MRIIALLLALVSSAALAGEATLEWTPPAKRTDGTTLDNLAGYRIYYSVEGGTEQTQSVSDPAATRYTLTGLEPGLWSFSMISVDADGLESVRTGVVTKQVIQANPEPPADLRVSPDNPTAYTVVKRVDRFVMLPVGTVQPGTSCIQDQTVNGYYVVPRASVQWSGSIKPDVVVAQCG